MSNTRLLLHKKTHFIAMMIKKVRKIMQRTFINRTQHIHMNRTCVLLKSFKQVWKWIIYKKFGVFVDISVYCQYLSSDVNVLSICFALNQWQLYELYKEKYFTILNKIHMYKKKVYATVFTPQAVVTVMFLKKWFQYVLLNVFFF
jgi:hypothetical protein